MEGLDFMNKNRTIHLFNLLFSHWKFDMQFRQQQPKPKKKIKENQITKV